MTHPINVTRSSLPPMEEYIEEIRELWDSRWITNMGSKHRTFQEQLRAYLGVPDVELLVNGHMALEMTIQALGLTGEVITTPFTFASTTHAIVRNGLTPVFCDIRPDDYTMDAEAIEPLITERTSAIIPVHVYGNICDVEQIQAIADRHNLKVVYDAAHTFGETWKGKGIGAFGDVSCFSFHATKVFNSIEGGAACFSSKSIGHELYDLKNFGIHGPETVSGIGANAKMNEFCAAMGICNLRHVDEEIAGRRAVDERYRRNLAGVPGITLNPEQPGWAGGILDPEQPGEVGETLNQKQPGWAGETLNLEQPDQAGKTLNPERPDEAGKTDAGLVRNYAYFPILIDEKQFGATRDEIADHLAQQGIYARKYFYPLTSQYDCYAGRFNPAATPVALDISRRILTLPIYADLPLREVDRVCEIILEIGKSK